MLPCFAVSEPCSSVFGYNLPTPKNNNQSTAKLGSQNCPLVVESIGNQCHCTFLQQTLPTAKMMRFENGNYHCHRQQIDSNEANDNHHHRKKRDVVAKFHTMVVLWHIKRFSHKLPQATQLSVFQQAFQQWNDASRLNFSYTVNETAAHIKISFLRGKLRVSSNHCGKV